MAILHHCSPFCASPVLRSTDDRRRSRSERPLGRFGVVRTRWEYGTRFVTSAAAGENSESVSDTLTEEEALKVLGVSKETPFEEIVKIKNKLLMTPNVNKESMLEIERAYDLLLMKSMTKRVQGSDQIPTNVRYADVHKRDFAREARKMFSKVPTGGVAVENPSNEILKANSIALGVLALCILPQGFSELSTTYDTIPGLYLALAFVWSVYSLRQYRLVGFGRSVGYTFLGLLIGACLGGAIEAAIHIQDHPLGAFHSPATLVSEFSLLGIWACATFLA